MKISEYYKEDSYIHYSNCHEDADMLLKYLPTNSHTILSVGSGLDNSLAFLVNDNVTVTSFDYNITQFYLEKLKKTAIKYLFYEEYLIFLGIKEGNSLNLFRFIESKLDEDVRDYFNNHLYLISDVGLVNCGRFEYYFQIFKNKVFPKVINKGKQEVFMEQSTLSSQIEFYNKYINNFRFKLMFRIFFSKLIMKKIGRDKEYFKYNKSSLSKMLKRRFELGIKNNLNKDNPYLNYVILNKFKALPFYLRKENFLKIKKNINNLSIHYSSFDNILKDKTFDYMNLSDIFEYIPNEEMGKYSDLIFKYLNNGGRVAYWNMMNIRQLKMKRINDITDLERDKAFYYRDFLVYEKNYD